MIFIHRIEIGLYMPNGIAPRIIYFKYRKDKLVKDEKVF